MKPQAGEGGGVLKLIPRRGFWEFEFRTLTIVTAHCACKFKLKPSKAASLSLSLIHAHAKQTFISTTHGCFVKKKKKSLEIKFRKLTAQRRPKLTNLELGWHQFRLFFCCCFFFFYMLPDTNTISRYCKYTYIQMEAAPSDANRGAGGGSMTYNAFLYMPRIKPF